MWSKTVPTQPETDIPANQLAGIGTTAALLEALPYVARFVGKTVVVKIGGSIGQDGTALDDVVTLDRLGVKPVVVHGGGPMISEWQNRMGLEPRFVDGRRYTDELTLDLARMVLIGKVNSDLVAYLASQGAKAVGISGIDGGLIKGRIRDPKLGFVGEVTEVDLGPVKALMDAGYLVVIAPAAIDRTGQPLNVNADSIAGDIARALNAEKLVFFTDVDGVLDKNGDLLSSLTVERVWELIGSREIKGGMIPKVEACVRALDTVPAAHILDGRVPHALIAEMFTDAGVGTMIARTASA
jgi:acetylglutamate kinase